MTTKRDFKRRVRARQARTGESYVTARRRLLAERRDTIPPAVPGDDDTDRELAPDPARAATSAVVDAADPAVDSALPHERFSLELRRALALERGEPSALPAIELEDISGRTLALVERAERVRAADDATLSGIVASAVPVVELRDVSAEAAHLGFRCRIAVFPSLLERIDATDMLDSLRDALVRNRDPAAARLFGIAFGVASPGPVREELSAAVRRGFAVLARIEGGGVGDGGSSLVFHVGIEPVVCMPDRNGIVVLGKDDLLRRTALSTALIAPPLFVSYQGRRQRIIRDPFVIGRNRPTCDLVLHDGNISRRHAAVICHAGFHYIKDLGSANGIVYRGMRIGHKRIVDGDVFRLGEHELHFTYRGEP